MKPFHQSTAGRLLMVAVALPLATGACVIWTPQGSGMVWIIASVFAGIILGLVGIGLAVEEFDREAVAALLFLPPALLLYTPLVGIAGGLPMVRLAMGLVAMVLIGVASGQTFSRLRFPSSPRATTHSA
jgi:hypothetical protein